MSSEMSATTIQTKPPKKDVDSSIHVAIEDLHFHMRKCKEEGESLRKQKEQLLQTLESKNVTARQLRLSLQQLERMNSELQERVRVLSEENDRLRKESRQKPVASKESLSRKPFKHSVDIMGSESWEDLSIKLMEQMEKDIHDLHDLGEKVNNGTLDGTRESPRASPSASFDDREAIQVVTEMRSQLSTIKERLLQQKTLLQNAARESTAINQQSRQRPSDDSFRNFFTQQLSSSKKQDTKQCPMCKEFLSSGTTQAEYEEHVMSHLESASSNRF